MINILKKQGGFTATDVLIAVLVITLFTGLISALTYNIYLANESIKRNEAATSYIVSIFEEIDSLYYDDITGNKLDELKNNLNIPSGYTVEATVNNTIYDENGQEISQEENSDLVKTIVVTVKYKIGNKEETLTMNKFKARENLITPNKPDLNSLREQIEESELTITPIKYGNNGWEITTEEDTTWYNYYNGNWATVVVTTGTGEDTRDILYIWIPRYVSDNGVFRFLYSSSNKYVDNKKLVDIEDPAQVIFEDNEKGKWIKTTDISINVNVYNGLYNVYGRINSDTSNM